MQISQRIDATCSLNISRRSALNEFVHKSYENGTNLTRELSIKLRTYYPFIDVTVIDNWSRMKNLKINTMICFYHCYLLAINLLNLILNDATKFLWAKKVSKFNGNKDVYGCWSISKNWNDVYI